MPSSRLSLGDSVALMVWHLHAINLTQLWDNITSNARGA